ncbi:hypothetical protein IG631_21718 [Alternaria alternata]|nr:hypothetical protein IG631_21718 [Alternaria alternata]
MKRSPPFHLDGAQGWHASVAALGPLVRGFACERIRNRHRSVPVAVRVKSKF